MSRYLVQLNNIELVNFILNNVIYEDYGYTDNEDIDLSLYNSIPGHSTSKGYFVGESSFNSFVEDKDSLNLVELELEDNQGLLYNKHLLDNLIVDLSGNYYKDCILLKSISTFNLVMVYTKVNNKVYGLNYDTVKNVLTDTRRINDRLKTLSKRNLWVNKPEGDIKEFNRKILNNNEVFTKLAGLIKLINYTDEKLNIIFGYLSFRYSTRVYDLSTIINEIGFYDCFNSGEYCTDVVKEILDIHKFVTYLYERAIRSPINVY